MDGTFVNSIRELMPSWGWSPAKIERTLPKVLEICVRVGILLPQADGFRLTELAEDDAAWERVWSLLDEEGVGDDLAS